MGWAVGVVGMRGVEKAGVGLEAQEMAVEKDWGREETGLAAWVGLGTEEGDVEKVEVG